MENVNTCYAAFTCTGRTNNRDISTLEMSTQNCTLLGIGVSSISHSNEPVVNIKFQVWLSLLKENVNVSFSCMMQILIQYFFSLISFDILPAWRDC